MTTSVRVALLLALLSSQAQGQEFVWETDLAEARAKAKEESRPLLVVFR